MMTRHILGMLAVGALLPTTLPAQHMTVAMVQDMGITAPALPAGGDFVRVENDPGERAVDFVLGPMDLKSNMAHLRLPIQIAELPVDGWLHGFEATMEDGDGNAIPMDLLHHVNFIDPDKRDVFEPIARRIIAAGRETHEKKLPPLLGYPIEAGDRMIISSMFANPTGTDYPEAYLRVRIFYSLEEDGFMQPRDVYPFYLDVMGPVGAKSFAVPPGKTVHAYEASPAVEGRILGIGGHLHDYATALRLEDVTEGKVLWEAETEYNDEGRLTGVSESLMLMTGGIKVSPDHVYRIYVEYENPMAHPAPDGGMGEIGGVIWASKDVAWPEFSREDPAYVADLVNTLEAPEKAGGHGHGDHTGRSMEGMDHGQMDHGGMSSGAAASMPHGHEARSEHDGH
ncbi:MAG: hypothetical protein KJO06_13260 [Gemmatimonadetes bacterium]|nr:hypothetical protein [Gemmatimonadota bacterium]